jgi:hypothetical protein
MFQAQTIRHYPRLSISIAVDVFPKSYEYEGEHERLDELEFHWLLRET